MPVGQRAGSGCEHAEPAEIPCRHRDHRRDRLTASSLRWPFWSIPNRATSASPFRPTASTSNGDRMARRADRFRPAGRTLSRHARGRAWRRQEHARRLHPRSRRPVGSISRRTAKTCNARRPTICANFLAALSARKLSAASVARKLSAVRQFYRFLYAEGHRPDDPAAVIEGPKRGRPLPKVLSVKEVDTLLGCARRIAEADARRRRAPARGAARVPSRSALRHRAAHFRTGRAAGVGVAPRRTHAGGARQGRPRTAGPAQRPGARHHARLSGADRAERQAGEIEMAVSVIRRKRPSDAPACGARTQGARGRGGDSAASGQPACAAPRLCQSPACKTAPICGSFRPCSVTPISQRRRSTRTFWKSD